MRHATLPKLAIASVSALMLTAAFVGAASGAPPNGNAPPDTPLNLATEYPQAEPVLHATFSDRDGGQGQVLYTVYDVSSGAVVLQDAAGPLVASGTDSPFTIVAGTLADGTKYAWTASAFDGAAYSAPTTEPAFVATSDVSGGVQVTAVNPWGCELKARWPHPSVHKPKYIAAQTDIECVSVPPYTMWLKQDQSLFRSSWSGWRFVARNISYCRSGNHSAGQDPPTCRPGTWRPMTAWVHWNCVDAGFLGRWYHYRQEDSGEIRSGGVSYFAYDDAQTGPWNQDGTVECGKYL